VALARQPAAVSRLRQLAAADPDPHVRAAAKRALAGASPSARGDWIGLYLVDFDGAPLADAHYRLALADGLVKAGQADARGVVREASVPRGACEIVLPDDPPGR
jgi:hypothetical protein